MRRLALVVIVALTLAWSAARAADPLTKAALDGSSRTPVTVATTDGKSVKGTLQAVTPELLVVVPSTSGGSEQFPWSEVKRVSNGLTARLAMDAWMGQHVGHLCPTCHGERTVWCPVCKGTRHNPSAAVGCKTCKGELLLACKTKGEATGQIPCPNGCLRLGVGNWAKGPNGEMWCKFPFGNGGSTSFSQGHVGHVIVLDRKARSATDAGVCPVCGGTVKVNDAACRGSGQVPCPECLARQSAPPCPNHCDAGQVDCPTCHGTGLAS